MLKLLVAFRQVRERLQALGALLPMTIFLRQEIDRIQQVRSSCRDGSDSENLLGACISDYIAAR